MPLIDITTKGRIRLTLNGVELSQHVVETEAIEKALAHAAGAGDGTYVLRYPEKHLRVIGTLADPDTGLPVDTQAPTKPGTPTEVTKGATFVTFQWTPSVDNVGVTGYQVWIDGVPFGAPTTSTSFSATGRTPATQYSIRVNAFDAAGNQSEQSDPLVVTTDANAAPAWNTAQQELTTGNAYSLLLTTICSDADSNPITFSQVSGTLPTGLTFNSGAKTVSGTPSAVGAASVTFRASDGITFTDAVIVFNVLNADTTAPSVPSQPSGTAVSSSQVNLTWTAVTDQTVANARTSGLAGYKVYRDGALRATLGNVLSYSDTGGASSTQYSYTVSAYDVAGNESAQSTARLVTTLAGSSTEAADWQKRSTLPGVVWAHNFDTAAEVNRFRNNGAVGIAPNEVGGPLNFVADGFAGGGCVEINIATGATTGHSWWRPLSALAANDNGKSTADPAANGTVPVRSYSAASNSNYNFRKGYYAHPAVQAQYPYWPTAGTTDIYDGTEFWFQCRFKIQNTRWSPGNPPGKLLYIDITGMTGDQEIIVRSVNNPDSITGEQFFGTNPLLMYTSFGGLANSIIGPTQGSYTGSLEPGGPYAATCTYEANKAVPNACWEFPSNQWTTLLFHVIPGRDNAAFVGQPLANWPYADATIEVWKCDLNETAYTKIFEKFDLKWTYYSNPQSSGNGPSGQWHPPAFNSVSPSGYMNNVPAATGWYQRYTQPILSKDYIPPPGETAPAWWASAPEGQWTAIAGTSGQRIADKTPSPIPDMSDLGTDGNPAMITRGWTGATVDQRRREYLMVCNGGHGDYGGNEAYALSLLDAAPAWRRIADPTPNSFLTTRNTTNGVLTYGDGRPRSDHTSGWPVWGDGRVWFGAQSAVASGEGAAAAGVYSFNRDALGTALTPMAHTSLGGTINPYELHGRVTDIPLAADANGAYTFGCGAWHRWRHEAWYFAGFGYDRTTNYYWKVGTLGATRGVSASYIANNGNPFFNACFAACAHDLDIYIVGDAGNFGNARRFAVFHPSRAGASNAFEIVTNVTGTSYYPPYLKSCTALYLAKQNCFVIVDPKYNGKVLYKLQIPTTTVAGRKVYNASGQWVWSQITPAGATPAVDAGDAGTYGRVSLVEDMGDGQSALVYLGDVTAATYVYKIPAAGL